LVLLQPGICEDGGQVKVLVMGSEGMTRLALTFLVPDPLTVPTPIPLRGVTGVPVEDQMKLIRLYFPRNYETLLDFGYVMIFEADILYLTPKQTLWFYDSIRRDGMGAVNDRSIMSMAAHIAAPWADSVLSDAFPNDADAVLGMQDWCGFNIMVRYVINTNPEVPPIYRPYIGLEGTEFAWTPDGSRICVTIPKEGAVVTTYEVGAFGLGEPGSLPDPRFRTPGWVPHSMFWRYGNGTTWTHSERVNEYWNSLYNPYGPDIVLAEILFSLGRKLPDDVSLVHHLRTKFWEYRSSNSITLSFLEFIDVFGADTTPISTRIADASRKVKEATETYLQQEYDESLSMMEDAIGEMEGLRAEALRLKDRALAWVYLIEWLVVSGVLLFAGFTLWTLMIKRRLYRAVSATRMVAR
jgi:hypothetical protein